MAAASAAAIIGANNAAAQTAQPTPSVSDSDVIVVRGVRGAEQAAVDRKRNANVIVDSIAAEDIGKLPDVTISDSLQRITGVQIDRDAGEGGGINVRGLPQVGALLNGEVFLTAGSIDSVQPNFTDIPSQLFSGADVYKSSTANLVGAGITGTVDLRTRRPFDLRSGWTLAGSADETHGQTSDKWEPEANGLVGYHARNWGLSVSGTYSDVTLENSTDGMDQYGGQIAGEDSLEATSWDGILTGWGVNNAPLPPQYTFLTPGSCPRSGSGAFPSYASTGCDLDINGNGRTADAFYTSENFTVIDRETERKRIGANVSFQADVGDGFRVTADYFYTDQTQWLRQTGYQLNSASWLGATFVPLVATDTGVKINNVNGGVPEEFYTTQVYRKYLGDFEDYSEDDVQNSVSHNYNLEIGYDRGGNFTGEVRGIYANASQKQLQSYVQFTLADGAQWPNVLMPGQSVPAGTYVAPGGNFVFNANGIPSDTNYADVDMRGDHLAITYDPTYAAHVSNEGDYALKTVSSEGNYIRDSSLSVLRADGHYTFNDTGLKIDFGVRTSHRSSENTNFDFVAPMWGGNGAYTIASDGVTHVPSSVGCYVHWKAADVVLGPASSTPDQCFAGNSTGYFRANPYAGASPTTAPAIIASNMHQYSNLAGVGGTVWALDPHAMDDVLAFQNALFPGEVMNVDPGQSWKVTLNQTTAYVQANFQGSMANFPFAGNVGVQYIQTDLGVDQHIPGAAGQYGLRQIDTGITHTDRTFTDTLPRLNVAVDLTDDMKLRFAFAKNMELLNLDQWGGALALNYGIVAGSNPPVFAVLGGSQNGNPQLNPWRSTNYDLSFEYYMGRSSIVSVALFYVDVASFITNGNITRTDLPDEDGVVRNRSVVISSQVQGAGAPLRGAEFDWKQSFDFLPGLLHNTGAELNYTYSPSNSGGKDLAGNDIPFQDNSREQANMILWYQDDRLQLRLAGNYRSKRAANANFGGIPGMEMYQDSTFYVDGSASYDITPNWQVFMYGSNLTGENERFYLVWPSQVADTTQFETRYTIGVRARF
ncbi:MAG: TonB-dependent receptor [Terricaulis silvestris]